MPTTEASSATAAEKLFPAPIDLANSHLEACRRGEVVCLRVDGGLPDNTAMTCMRLLVQRLARRLSARATGTS